MADFERSEGAVPRSVRISGALSRTNPILSFPTHSCPNVLNVLDGHLHGVHFHCADFTFRELALPASSGCTSEAVVFSVVWSCRPTPPTFVPYMALVSHLPGMGPELDCA